MKNYRMSKNKWYCKILKEEIGIKEEWLKFVRYFKIKIEFVIYQRDSSPNSYKLRANPKQNGKMPSVNRDHYHIIGQIIVVIDRKYKNTFRPSCRSTMADSDSTDRKDYSQLTQKHSFRIVFSELPRNARGFLLLLFNIALNGMRNTLVSMNKCQKLVYDSTAHGSLLISFVDYIFSPIRTLRPYAQLFRDMWRRQPQCSVCATFHSWL